MTVLRRSFRVKGFAALAGSYALNELGDNLGVVALAILVLNRTGSAMAMTAFYAASKFVPALVAPAVTAALDRRPVGRVVPLLYTAEAVAFAGLALLATGSFSLPAVLALALLDGILAITARGLTRGAVAALLAPAGVLREGNAVINMAFALTSAAGPVLAGLLVHEGGVATALWADAASFVVVALLLLVRARTLPVPARGPREGWLARARDGLDYVRSHPTAGRLIAGEAAAILFFTVTVPIEVIYVKQALDSSSLGFGILLATWGIGIVLGSAIFTRARRASLATLVVLSTAAVGLGYAEMAIAPTLAIACIGSVIGGTGNGVQWVAVMTALQEAVGDEYQARAAGLLESAGAAVPGLGFLVGGVLTSLVSARTAYAVAALGVGAVVVAFARRPVVPETAVSDSAVS